MLLLSRKRDEIIRVRIPATETTQEVVIEFMVVELQGAKVRLGITAPQWITVHRAEIDDQIAAEATRQQ